MRVGDMVMAIGNALALEGGPTVSLGIISAKDRTITAQDGSSLSHLIQTDAAINEGDSGGPLVNASGKVIGINTISASEAQNIGFAIAIDEAMEVIDGLIDGG
jgi:S1-C subfamily serine protease